MLSRGTRLVEILKQDQYVPMPVERQVVIIYAGTNGLLDAFPESALVTYEAELARFIENTHPAIYSDILTKGALDDELKGQIETALKEFNESFSA